MLICDKYVFTCSPSRFLQNLLTLLPQIQNPGVKKWTIINHEYVWGEDFMLHGSKHAHM
jgi:hypothetical protein